MMSKLRRACTHAVARSRSRVVPPDGIIWGKIGYWNWNRAPESSPDFCPSAAVGIVVLLVWCFGVLVFWFDLLVLVLSGLVIGFGFVVWPRRLEGVNDVAMSHAMTVTA